MNYYFRSVTFSCKHNSNVLTIQKPLANLKKSLNVKLCCKVKQHLIAQSY